MLYLGADHNGYFLKEEIKKFLQNQNIVFHDFGAVNFLKTDDYVDYAVKVGKVIKVNDTGLLICGSGHGMVIAANKLSGIRATMPLSAASARQARKEDFSNVLVLAAREMDGVRAKKLITAFLSVGYGRAARYGRRLKKIKQLER